MYGQMSTAGVAGGSATGLALTGFNGLAIVVAAITLVFLGLALMKLFPRKQR